MFATVHTCRRLFTCLVVSALVLLFAQAQAAAQTIDVVKTESGLTAWLISDETVPIITMRFLFKNGATLDPEGREGTAELLTTLFDEGAGEMDSRAFQRTLQDLSMGLGFNAGRDSLSGSLSTLSANKEAAFEMLRLAINEPLFDDEAIERMRAQLLVGARSRESNPDTIATRTMARQIFDDHPYRRSSTGTPESLEAITRDDLITAYDTLLTRDHLVIAVVGDISADELGPLIEHAFVGLPQTADRPELMDAEIAFGGAVGIEFDSPQTLIRLVGPGLSQKDPDYLAAIVMNQILGGGGLTSRLFREVRERRGLTYGVSTGLLPLKAASLFMGGTATAADKAAETIDVMRAELERMATEGPTADEVEAAKSYLIGSYALRFDTSGSIAGQLLGIQVDDLGIDYFGRRNDLVRAITLEDVRRAAQRILASEPFTWVIVGAGAEELAAGL